MQLYKAVGCKPCERLSEFISNNNLDVPTKVITFGSLRKGEYPFSVVPSLVLDDGSVISGLVPIRLKLLALKGN
jgi:hypothetical protein